VAGEAASGAAMSSVGMVRVPRQLIQQSKYHGPR
jgi:hypothetical protein